MLIQVGDHQGGPRRGDPARGGGERTADDSRLQSICTLIKRQEPNGEQNANELMLKPLGYMPASEMVGIDTNSYRTGG